MHMHQKFGFSKGTLGDFTVVRSKYKTEIDQYLFDAGKAYYIPKPQMLLPGLNWNPN